MTEEDTEIYTCLGTDEQLKELVSDLIKQYGEENITTKRVSDLANSQIEQYNHNILYQFNELVMILGQESSMLRIKEEDVGCSPIFYMRVRIGDWYEMRFGDILFEHFQIYLSQ
tara:strand:- start:310 stop:651 length:342 start_codon:yes stop_codon:yes gene_type:complete